MYPFLPYPIYENTALTVFRFPRVLVVCLPESMSTPPTFLDTNHKRFYEKPGPLHLAFVVFGGSSFLNEGMMASHRTAGRGVRALHRAAAVAWRGAQTFSDGGPHQAPGNPRKALFRDRKIPGIGFGTACLRPRRGRQPRRSGFTRGPSGCFGPNLLRRSSEGIPLRPRAWASRKNTPGRIRSPGFSGSAPGRAVRGLRQ